MTDKPLRDVMEGLTRWFNLDIKIPDSKILDRKTSVAVALDSSGPRSRRSRRRRTSNSPMKANQRCSETRTPRSNSHLRLETLMRRIATLAFYARFARVPSCGAVPSGLFGEVDARHQGIGRPDDTGRDDRRRHTRCQNAQGREYVDDGDGRAENGAEEHVDAQSRRLRSQERCHLQGGSLELSSTSAWDAKTLVITTKADIPAGQLTRSITGRWRPTENR